MTEPRSYRFTVKGKPVGKQRPRVVMKGNYPTTYTPKETVQYEKLIATHAKQTGMRPMSHVRVGIAIFTPIKGKRFKTKEPRLEEPLRRADVDNIAKCCLDAMNGIAYKDDKSVLELSVQIKFIAPDEEPAVGVMVQEVDWNNYKDTDSIYEWVTKGDTDNG